MALKIQVEKTTLLIPESDDSCNLWETYFTDLSKVTTKSNAKKIWLITWQSNSSSFSTCTTSASFNAFLKKNDIDVSSAGSRAIADVSATIGNVFGIGKNLTKTLSLGVPVLISAVLVTVVIMLIKSAKKIDLVDVAKMTTPLGKASTIMA